MFKTPSILTRNASFGQRVPAQPAAAAAADVPAHVRAEWTGEQAPRQNDAAARINALLA